MQKSFLFLVLLTAAQYSFAQVRRPQNKQDIIAVCDRFMEIFKNGKYQQAFDSLKLYSVLEDYKLDTLANTSSQQLNGLSSSFGKTLGYEKIAEKDARNCLIKLVYLLKFEKYFVKVVFVLYNNGSGWTITNFKYDEEIDDLF
jgi:hypothetical protein